MKRSGFTIVEVVLVLAMTGLLLIGVIAGLGGSVARQRYNDTVQDVAEYMRAVYSSVENPSGEGNGKGNKAFYGKMIVLSSGSTQACDYSVFANADIEAKNMGNDTRGTLFKDGNLRNGASMRDGDNKLAQSCHTLQWGGSVDAKKSGSSNKSGVLSILYSPIDNSVHTYFTTWSGTPNVETFFNGDTTNLKKVLKDAASVAVDLCVRSEDAGAAGGVRDIRIAKDGHNATAVQLVDVDSGDNKCS